MGSIVIFTDFHCEFSMKSVGTTGKCSVYDTQFFRASNRTVSYTVSYIVSYRRIILIRSLPPCIYNCIFYANCDGKYQWKISIQNPVYRLWDIFNNITKTEVQLKNSSTLIEILKLTIIEVAKFKILWSTFGRRCHARHL